MNQKTKHALRLTESSLERKAGTTINNQSQRAMSTTVGFSVPAMTGKE